jgi:hypothetical protein
LTSRAAYGQETPAAPAPPASPPIEPDEGVVLEGWIGGGANATVQEQGWGGGLALGVTGLYHSRWFEAGLAASGQFALFSSSSTILGVLAGVKADALPWLRLELLAEGGANSVSGAGTELFSASLSGDNAVLPYLGGRAGVSALLGHSRRFLLGWWVSGGDDVGRVTIHPVIQSCFLMCSQTAETFTIGGPSWSTGLRIGGELSRW